MPYVLISTFLNQTMENIYFYLKLNSWRTSEHLWDENLQQLGKPKWNEVSDDLVI